MQTKRRDLFATVRTEGAMLPADLLQRIVDSDSSLEGLKPDDYHRAGERLNEVINGAWNRLLGQWQTFQTALKKLPEDDIATSVTRERWLLPLFRELDYGRLSTTPAVEIEGKSYAISHGWQQTPIHLVGWQIDLDHRTPGVAGASKTSPHSLVQEFLNRSNDHLWAFLANGKRLRILRDNVSLTRQAYVEFDLEAMMNGEVYADFALLWLLCHQSRVECKEGERPEQCWLEKWSRTAQDSGTRALDSLRQGVEDAIKALGRGFLAHSANSTLSDKLYSGNLPAQDYYRQLLRMVYRLLFLFVAEDRDLLLLPDADDKTRERFARFYSTARLRRLAERHRGTRHCDHFEGFLVVMQKLGSAGGCAELGLPALGSFLWSEKAIADLVGCKITNADFLAAVRALAFTVDNQTLRAVDYRNLGAEELGSVYESLLELHPKLNADAGTFELDVAAGHERKTTGSYYTPTSLINCLLDSALDPVLDEAAKKPTAKESEAAILNLKICDPACGSGHFLIAAAHRVAKRLAAVRTGDEEPAPEATRQALRDVIGHCIFGVDINPMAVELCKINLWLESLEPGRPLSFLDHHIQCGNSLLGTTPALLKKGIPDEAFKPIEGDDKKLCREYKKQNRDERAKQKRFDFDGPERPWTRMGNSAVLLANLETLDDDSLESVQAKEERYAKIVGSADYLSGRFLADTWCAAFVWKKTKEFDYTITEDIFRRVERNPHDCAPWMRAEIQRLAKYYKFFHWHLAFPQVFRVPRDDSEPENKQTGCSGGFDVMLGNPPWDALSPDAKEFFAAYDPQVRFQDRDGQKQIIEGLLHDATVADRWAAYCRDLYTLVSFVKQSGRYRMFAPGNLGKGDFNVYRMFVETTLSHTRYRGWAAQVVPEGLYNGANCMAIRKSLFNECRLVCLIGFENANENWFTDIDTRMKFCIYAAQVGDHTESFDVAFNVRSVEQLAEVVAGDRLRLPIALVPQFSPDALAILEIGSQRDIDIAEKMYRWPAMGNDTAGPPMCNPLAEIHMGNNRELFEEDATGIPLCEGRMVAQYDHRAKAYVAGRGRAAVWEDLPFGDKGKRIQPQWYLNHNNIPPKLAARVALFRSCFCKVVSPTNERTLIATLIPPFVLCGDSVPTILFEPEGFDWFHPFWIAVANTYIMDFIVRMKVALNLTMTVMDSLPFPRPRQNDPRIRPLVERSMRLLCSSPETIPFWNKLAADGWVSKTTSDIPGELNEETRLSLQAEIDIIVARDLFNLTRSELEYILTTFPTQQRYQEEKYGEFRSRRLILENFDAMAEAIRTGQPYQTILDPPPGPPTDAEGNFIPMSQWDKSHWPSHIHQPREAEVSVPTPTQRKKAEAVVFAQLLLSEWGQPVLRENLECALILAFNDGIRQKAMGAKVPADYKPKQARYIQGFDHTLASWEKSEAVSVENRSDGQYIGMGTKSFLETTLAAQYRQTAKGAVAVWESLKGNQNLGYFMTQEDYDAVAAIS